MDLIANAQHKLQNFFAQYVHLDLLNNFLEL